ncbi:PilZ domain-containing protein [Cellulomonas gelida]|uniref:PilZ domain-containing protein n=1 Tax=Cellulomonas gelida TaxID=1712 RepID=UPI0036219C0F
MHDLAVCHVGAKHGSTIGFVEKYETGVLVARVQAPLENQHIGDVVHAVVLDPVKGECRYTGLIGGVSDEHVSVVVQELVAQNQRRSCARASYSAACIGVLERVPTNEAIRLSVVDVSASGIRFASPTALDHGDVVRLSLPVDAGSVDLRARVLRIEEATWGWRYGCDLLDLSEPTREALFRLVLRLQREEARARADR